MAKTAIKKKKPVDIKKYKYRFRLRTSSHVNEDGYFFTATDPKNNIVHTDVNLAKKFGRDKFELLDADDPRHDRRTPFTSQQVRPKEDVEREDREREEDDPALVKAEAKEIEETFGEMELDELQRYAEKNEIDLDGASTKDEVLEKVLEHEQIPAGGSDDD